MLPVEPRVIVGVDDSPASRWALAWAVGAARLWGMALVAVHVSRAPVHPFPEALPYTHAIRQFEEARSVELIHDLFEDMAGGTPSDLTTASLARLGEPGPLLVELARPGDLLVVGRGVGVGWTGCCCPPPAATASATRAARWSSCPPRPPPSR
ncbi:universal stress protein [Nonomuraea dietziae]|uniref:universal stress protein n=1 Tax=Nonomuraea dietziae TaxID=65515 RepID=UPI00360DDDDB